MNGKVNEMIALRNFDDLRSFLSSSTSLKALEEGLEINENLTASSLVEWLQEEIKSSIVDGLYRKRCTKCLNTFVKKYHVFPSSFFCDDVRRDGDHPLGGGRFADVYKGVADSQTVCLKVLRVHTQPDDKKRKKMVEDFCQEALIWTQLSHPNVLQLLGVNTTLFKTDFCLVSPWMVNGDIITFLNRTPDHDRLQSIREIVAGLEYLHSRSPVIVHGDIKGANILVDEDCNCRLADFGLSRETPGTTMFETSTGGMKGSLRWMAPEMFQPSTTRDSNEDRSPRDIYAYACTIVEIMTGRPPFPGLLDVVVMTQVLLNRARPERPTGVWCPDNVWELVEKCWDQDRLKRPTATYIHNYLSGLTETDSSLDAVPPVSAISHHEASVPIFPRTISLTALEQAINEDIIILNPSLIQPILDDPSPNVNPRFTDNILTQNNAFRKPESRVRSRSFTQYLTKLVPNTTLATTSLQTDDDSHWEQSSFYENVLGTPTLDKRPSIQPGAKFVQNYFTKLVPASKRLYSTAVAIARSFEDPFENVLRPPPDETPKQAAERIAREVEAKRVSDAIDAQLRGEWMRGRDDDFEAFLRPPPSETVEQATERVEREAEARKVSDAIDAELRAEWNRVQEERKAVNSLLLVGLAGSGKTTVLKNFIARYDSATWDTERSIWCTVIKLNVISLLLDLVDWICSDIQALQTDDGEPHDDKSTVHGFASRHLLLINPLKPLHQLTPVPVLQRALAEHVRSKHLWFSTGFPDPDQEPSDISLERSIIENAFKTVVANKDSIKALWEDENVQKAFKCRTIRGSPGFFLEHLDRITSATYFPTDDDLLHAYLPTRGHQDYRFLLDGKRILRITDLEGNRAQRYLLKSILLQEHYDTVIFLCPICTFDEVLEEDHSVNHLEESILLWRAICSIETLSATQFILYLNKHDLLEQKLKTGVSIKKYIPSYAERPNESPDFANYVTQHMKAVFKTFTPLKHSRSLHVFTTTATVGDTMAIKQTLEETILERLHDQNLQGSTELL